MRIERVVAGTFNEASERSRRLYGPNILLISSSRVGNSHELLVCTNDSANDEQPIVDVEAREAFAATLQEEMLPQAKRPFILPSTAPEASKAATPAVDTDSGQALVGIIRKELQALEMRLASSNGNIRGLHQKMALLEQGVSAVYASRLIEAGLESADMANRLLEDLNRGSEGALLGERTAVFVGPAAGGKTTAAMQAARSVAKAKSVPAVVSASRDARPGARERFFAMADAAQVESSWGGVAPGALVVDAGGYSREDLAVDRPELAGYDLYLCIPAYLNRSTAARWFDCVGPLAGVILTHWSPTEVPLGLLGSMAERGLRLAGLSASADPNAALIHPTVETLGGPVRNALELTLEVVSTGVE